MNKLLATLFFLLIPALAPAAELELTQEQLTSAGLTTTTVTTRELKPRLKLTGTLTADRRKSNRVTPVVDGMVTELLAVENEAVRKGQVLARLRSNSLGQAQADYLETLARFELARAERARIRLVEKTASSPKAVGSKWTVNTRAPAPRWMRGVACCRLPACLIGRYRPWRRNRTAWRSSS